MQWMEIQLDTCSIFVSGRVDLLKESAVSGSQKALSRYPTPLVGSLGLQDAREQVGVPGNSDNKITGIGYL